MSASRALASAKNKKAGGNNPNPAVTIPEPSYSQNVAQQNPNSSSVTKVTIPQALQMLSNRVDVLEEKVSKSLTDLEENRLFEKQAENKYLVDAQVFNSIVSRIEQLEQIPHKNDFNDQVKNSEPLKEVQLVQSDLSIISNDLQDFKKDFMKLQTYVMDTNAKLTEVVFSMPIESMVDYRDIFVKKSEDLIEPSIPINIPVDRMTSTPDMSEIDVSAIDPSSLERPILTRHIAHTLTAGDIETLAVSQNVTSINDIVLPRNSEDSIKLDISPACENVEFEEVGNEQSLEMSSL